MTDSIAFPAAAEQQQAGGAALPLNGHRKPDLPDTHLVDNRIYTDQAIFDEEQRTLFQKVWMFVCHESEIPNRGDFRTTKVAGKPIVIVRGDNGAVRTFFNVCRHRAAEIVREEFGNARSFTCFYHHWCYGLGGELLAVTRPSGYDAVKLQKEQLGLIPVRTELVAGLVFVCLDPAAESLSDYLGGVLEPVLQPLGTLPLEVFHFHKAIINTNWKLWQDNNSERYHALLHHFNVKTSPWVTAKQTPVKLHLFRNGHCGTWNEGGETETVSYGKGGYTGVSGWSLPSMRENEMRVLNIFPDLLVNIRSNVIRLDRMIPLSPGRTLVEWRGLGVKGDSEEAREVRLRHHNLVWGPAGRNLPEDILAVESQWRAMEADVVRYSVLAREEDLNPTDDANVRAYYAEWERRTGRAACAPFHTGLSGKLQG